MVRKSKFIRINKSEIRCDITKSVELSKSMRWIILNYEQRL